jgi:hypothetical protein
MESVWLVAMRQAALHRNHDLRQIMSAEMSTNPLPITATRQLLSFTSRRGLLAAAIAGLLAALPFANGGTGSEAKKKRKRKKKGKNKQSQTSITAACSGTAFRINTGGERRLAQPFVALASGPLVSATLELDQKSSTDGAGDYILHLSPVDDESVPTNQVLAESVVAGSSVTEGPSTVVFEFAEPFAVKAGIEYALVLARPESEQFAWGGDLGDRCAGHLFFSPDQAGAFFPFDPAVEVRFTAVVKT